MSNNEDYQDFVSTLDSFKELKSGISGSRIKKLTTYALDHVADEERIIPALIEYSRSCEDSHKLGSLYIIDSVGRAYLDEARARDDYIKPTARVGSCAHGVYTLGEAIQELLSDSINKSNDDHREKIRMLIDIWDRSGLFQKGYLNAVRAKCFSMEIPNVINNSHSSNISQPSSNETLSPTLIDRSNQILSTVKSLDLSNIPKINVPSKLSSNDATEREDALRELLSNMYDTFSKLENNNQIEESKRTHVHKITEYGSRRERERQGFKRSRSKSPRRDTFQPPATQHIDNNAPDYAHPVPTNNFGTNNHHLYPDEVNVPQNPHYRAKPVSFDPSLEPNSVKVFSRTLFIGGVPMNMKEWDFANMLRPFAEVQSVILNHHRKHAFVKVYSRQEAENVFMNFNKDGALPLRTRWGVGFGPRDCCNYQHGFSVIPLHRLTDADKKWTAQAQWGGTGGQVLAPGMVFEEPDIIVGDGITSKSISQKMPTDSGRNGPKSNRDIPYNSPPPNQMYGQLNQQQQGGYPPMPQQDVYNQGIPLPPQQGMPPVPQQGYQQNQPMISLPPQPQQDQGNFDPAAQLNSLMNMLNQQQN